MKPKSKIIIIQTLSVIFLFCAAAYAQEGQIVGGYAQTDVTNKDVVAAAKFALKKRGSTSKTNITLIKIERAEQQIVAGINYRLCLKVKYTRRAKGRDEGFVEVVVYRNLKKVYELTEWTVRNCAGQQFPQ